MNRKIVVLAEGDTERAARDHLKRFLDRQAGERPKVELHISLFHGGLKEDGVRGRAEKFLKEPGTLGVIALTDIHPAFRDAEHARQILSAWMPDDPRCHVRVAKHDFEAWLLVDWNAILKKANIPNKKPWGARPEEIDGDKPPAHRLRDLFQHEAKPKRDYKKVVDGKTLFQQLELTEVARVCPEFKRFLNCLLELAGYPLVP